MDNREICRRCRLKDVEAEPIDSTFRLNCNKCATYRTEELREKWITRSESVLHSCYRCLTSFRLKHPLVPHQCTREDVFPCSECGQHLYSAEDLRNHTKSVHKKKSKVENEQCKMDLGERVRAQKESSESSAENEVQSTSGGNKVVNQKSNYLKPKQCKYCSKRLSCTSALTKHLIIHSGEKPFQCNICGRNFSRFDALKMHLETHIGEKRYQCNLCGKKFSRNDHLQRHHRTHSGENPYQCKMCPKSFSQSSNLKSHLRTHTGEKPYQCKFCESRFSTSSYLKKHLRIHTGEKPHQCKICEKNFSRIDNLNKHILTHAGGKPNQCKICMKKFSQSNSLMKHSNKCLNLYKNKY